jgi:hypothetical protein
MFENLLKGLPWCPHPNFLLFQFIKNTYTNNFPFVRILDFLTVCEIHALLEARRIQKNCRLDGKL